MKYPSFNLASDGWLSDVEVCASPNFNQRPAGAEISLLVIHNISLPPGQFGGREVHKFFTNCLDCSAHPALADLHGVKVSSHLLIDREGAVTQFVPLTERAWHAGQSCFEGRDNCNDFSIGIELEGTDIEPYTEAQYGVLAEVTKTLLAHYPLLSPARIVGHSDIAPGRKTDPGPAFDWHNYKKRLS
ncbi:AmpD protein [Litorivivens lipolytica]|uniref:1,6-anhydro-N-acetylmuramyl-L-alanine amidase AmpD n=1 Tax=Litorivivens lipolytica TaxID=1524264 RepID=A0A7W4Z6B7_9GAMM|nr:AmpD protein [Litorivivens lipolytica]